MAKRKPTPDVLRLIRDAQPPEGEEGTITTPELARAMGCNYDKALQAAHALLAAGKIRPEKIWRRNIHGELQRVKGFRVA